MRTPPRAVALAGLTLTLMAGLVACGNNNNSSSGSSSAPPPNTKVGVLLPDTASSPRWVSADPNELRKQCAAQTAAVEVII